VSASVRLERSCGSRTLNTRVIRVAPRLDRPLVALNLLLLMVVAVIPFPTGLLAHYVRALGQGSPLAAAVYGGARGCAYRSVCSDGGLVRTPCGVP
jgi:hypothetical protein